MPSGRRAARPSRTVPRFFVQPFVDEGLGNSAYLVGSQASKEAALIDPLRDVDVYLKAAKRRGVEVTQALDTHLHNDFVSGCLEVAAATGAEVGASADAEVEFDHRPLRDGDRIDAGGFELRVLATPGHTPEHIAFLLVDSGAAGPIALFSGGALIVGGAARTDLLGADRADPLARRLYRTIHERLLALPDDVAVYPTHGAGSFCVAPGADERTTTIGLERRRNPLAQPQSEDAFVARALADLPAYPAYFGALRPINRKGAPVLGGVPRPRPLAPEAVQAWAAGGGAVVDVRPARAFAEGHIPRAYAIPVDAPLGTWAGWLLPYREPLVLVAGGPVDLGDAMRQLVRIGFDDVRGHLAGGMGAWRTAGLPVDAVARVGPADLRARLGADDAPVVLDVREDDEWAEGHIPGAVHLPSGRIPGADLARLRGREVVVHCGGANRSTAGLSVLMRRGLRGLALLDGGFRAWEAKGFEVERPGEA